jgi:hypothetical protein
MLEQDGWYVFKDEDTNQYATGGCLLLDGATHPFAAIEVVCSSAALKALSLMQR